MLLRRWRAVSSKSGYGQSDDSEECRYLRQEFFDQNSIPWADAVLLFLGELLMVRMGSWRNCSSSSS